MCHFGVGFVGEKRDGESGIQSQGPDLMPGRAGATAKWKDQSHHATRARPYFIDLA